MPPIFTIPAIANRGFPGASNYERARALQGFEGTEEEYLASLRGEDADTAELQAAVGAVAEDRVAINEDRGAIEIARDRVLPAVQEVATQTSIALDAAGLSIAQADASQRSAGAADRRAQDADGSAGIADAHRIAAQTQADRAEQFAIASALNGNFYPTIAAGRAAVADGAGFKVEALGVDQLARATIFQRVSSTTQRKLVEIVDGSEVDRVQGRLNAGDVPFTQGGTGMAMDASDGPAEIKLASSRYALLFATVERTLMQIDTVNNTFDLPSLRQTVGELVTALATVTQISVPGAGTILDSGEGPRVDILSTSRAARVTQVDGETVETFDTRNFVHDLSRFHQTLRRMTALQSDLGSATAETFGVGGTIDALLEEVTGLRIMALEAGRRYALTIGGSAELLGFDTLNNVLRPRAPAASAALPVGSMVLRTDGSLGLQGIGPEPGALAVPGASFLTNDNFPELIDCFFLTDDPAYATRATQMAAAGAITIRNVYGVPRASQPATAPRLWATFYARQFYDQANVSSYSAEGPGNYVVLAYSDHPTGATGTWKEVLYAVPVDKDVARTYDSFIYVLPNNQLMLVFAAIGGGNTYTGGRTGSYGVIIQNPDEPNGAFVWNPKPVDLGVGIASQFQKGADGKLYGALDVWRGPVANAAAAWRGKWLARLDFARVYDQAPKLALVSMLPEIATGRTYDETMIVQTLDGGWLAHFRSSNLGTYETRFNPVTQAWSAPVPFTAHPTAQNGTRTSLARSPSGRLVMAFNRNTDTRNMMAIAISDDDGVTWPHYYVFDTTRFSISYPILCFDQSGLIHVIYDYWRGQNTGGVKDIIWVTIPEASVIAGTPTHTSAFVSQ